MDHVAMDFEDWLASQDVAVLGARLAEVIERVEAGDIARIFPEGGCITTPDDA